MMDRDLARTILTEGGMLTCGTWTWCGRVMNCGDGCCLDYFKDIEETLDSIEMYCNWTDLESI